MGGQLFLLWRMGSLTPQAALPLHLCSFNGVIALPVLLSKCSSGWEFMLFLGLPGALGALLFPCVVGCPWQGWMNLFFFGLHTLLVLAALLPLMVGMRPRRCPWGAFLWGNGLVAMAMAANQRFNGNFLFLQSAPEGTPLAFLHRWGPWGYWMLLEALAALILFAVNPLMSRGLQVLAVKKGKDA